MHSAPEPKKPKVDGKRASEDATAAYNAMNGGLVGMGTDEAALFKALENKSPAQMATLKAAYQDHYHRDLGADLANELSGTDLTRAQALVSCDAAAAGAAAINQALGTVTNDNQAIYDALSNKSPRELQALEASYQREYGTSLESALKNGMSGDKLARAQALLAGDHVASEAAELSYAIRGSGTDETTVMKVLADKTPEQIAGLRAEFKKQGRNLDLELELDLSGPELRQAKALLGGTALTRAEKADKTGSQPANAATLKFRALADAAILEGALGANGGGARTVERTLSGKSKQELLAIADAYRTTTGRQLEKDLGAELVSGELTHAMELLRGEGDAPASLLRRALADAGTDEAAVKAVLEGKTKTEIADLAKDYQRRYGEDLKGRLESELSGRDLFDVRQLLEGEPTSVTEALGRLNARRDFERAGGANAVARVALDAMSDAGGLLDGTVDRANTFYRAALAENAAAGLAAELNPSQEAELSRLIGYGSSDVSGYRDARDTASEVAGNVAATAAAVGVTVATAGAAAPVVVGAYAAAAAGTASVVAKGAFEGAGYSAGAALQDGAVGAVEGALSVATLGGAAVATGAKTVAKAAAITSTQVGTNATSRVLGREAVEAIEKSLVGRVAASTKGGAALTHEDMLKLQMSSQRLRELKDILKVKDIDADVIAMARGSR